jgi:hypothetical protein
MTIFVKAQTVIRTRDGVVDERSSLKRGKSMRTPPAESDQMTGWPRKTITGLSRMVRPKIPLLISSAQAIAYQAFVR